MPFNRRATRRVPFGALRSAIEFYNCINTATRRQVRTFRELSSLCSFLRFFLFLFFRLPRARKRRRRGGTKKKAFSRCKIYGVQVSTRGRTRAQSFKEFSSLNRWKIDGDADESVPRIYFAVRFFLGRAVHERARG